MKSLEINELSKEMQDFLDRVQDAIAYDERSFYTTDDWFEEFGTEFPPINGYYVTDETIIESM